MPEGQEKPPKEGTFFFFLPDRVLKTARKKFQEEGTAGMKASRCQSTGVCDELIIAL